MVLEEIGRLVSGPRYEEGVSEGEGVYRYWSSTDHIWHSDGTQRDLSWAVPIVGIVLEKLSGREPTRAFWWAACLGGMPGSCPWT